jgi:hypothetical protein
LTPLKKILEDRKIGLLFASTGLLLAALGTGAISVFFIGSRANIPASGLFGRFGIDAAHLIYIQSFLGLVLAVVIIMQHFRSRRFLKVPRIFLIVLLLFTASLGSLLLGFLCIFCAVCLIAQRD